MGIEENDDPEKSEAQHNRPDGTETDQASSDDNVPAGESDANDEPAHAEPVVGKIDHTPDSTKTTTRIEIPIRTIITVVLSLVIIWILVQLLGILLQVFLAFLLATALLPLVTRLEKRGLPNAAASTIVFTGLMVVIVGFFGIIVPPLIEQGQSIVDNAPEYLHRFEGFISQYPSLDEQYQNLKDNGITGENSGDEGSVAEKVPVEQVIEISVGIFGRITDTFFVLILTFYLMLEGSRTWNFLSRYFTPRLRYRIERSYPPITRVISGYILGQSINSLAFGGFAFLSLTILGVPETLLLATLAAIFDAVPIVGVPIATIPALLLALTVSWQTAVLVLVLYTVYQQFENYVMVPRVFGNTLQVSALSILVGVLVGSQLLGVIGIILSLPITAAIPVLERVWNEKLPDDVVAAEP